MQIDKHAFIENMFLPLLKDLPAGAKGKWGKMNGQQMVEHVTGFFALSTGRLYFPLVTPLEHLPKMKEFLYSEKEFRENTKAPVLPEEPLSVKFATMHESLESLDKEVKDFIEQFSNNAQLKRSHPVFGELDFDEWILLHYKHVTHHLKQFGLV